MKLHQKGYLLVALSQASPMWDEVLIEQTCAEYGKSEIDLGNHLRIALDELNAAGLILCIDKRMSLQYPTQSGKPRLSFLYQLSDFGKMRMKETRLI